MCLQCPAIRLRNVDTDRSRQKETVGVRDEVLYRQILRISWQDIVRDEDIEAKNHSRHDQEKESRIVRPHLQNGRQEPDQAHPILKNGWKVS